MSTERASAPGHSCVGVLTSTDKDRDRAVQTDLVRCVHCGYMWQFVPGSGRRRGFCMRCNGFVCGQHYCEAVGCVEWRQQLENMEQGKPLGHKPISVSVPRILVPGGD